MWPYVLLRHDDYEDFTNQLIKYYIKHMAYNAYMEIAAQFVLSRYDNYWYLANCELEI